uniref:Uncharacterized protein n=1 Tax=Anguilla anguilla TaxID=7936 RepID=A0A0E9XCF2_ANGAN
MKDSCWAWYPTAVPRDWFKTGQAWFKTSSNKLLLIQTILKTIF